LVFAEKFERKALPLIFWIGERIVRWTALVPERVGLSGEQQETARTGANF
jgi:hypothetical protein